MRAMIYARVSLDAREGRSVAEQEAECRAWATREGWTIGTVITETGSASRYARSTAARTRWGEVTTAITTGDHDILLTWEASRAARDLTAYAALRDLCAQHNVLWGYSGTVYDLSQRDARFRTGLDALVAEDESARTSERVRRSARARAAAGQPHGKIPYGYRREYNPDTGTLLRQVPDEETAPTVREIYTRLLAGDALYTIARDLDQRHITPPRPARTQRPTDQTWLPITIRRIALSPTYKARRIHDGHDIGPAAWPPLVDDTTWDAVHAILTDPHRRTTTDGRAKHLLTGVARCSECNAPVRRVKNRGHHSYSCMRPGCMKVTRHMDRVDTHVTDVFLELLTLHAAELGAAVDDQRPDNPRVQAAREEAEALRRRLDGFVDDASDGQISRASLARIEARLLPQIAAAEAKLRRLQVPPALQDFDLSDPPRSWKALTVAKRRDLLRNLVDVHIRPVGRGNRWVDLADGIDVTPRW